MHICISPNEKSILIKQFALLARIGRALVVSITRNNINLYQAYRTSQMDFSENWWAGNSFLHPIRRPSFTFLYTLSISPPAKHKISSKKTKLEYHGVHPCAPRQPVLCTIFLIRHTARREQNPYNQKNCRIVGTKPLIETYWLFRLLIVEAKPVNKKGWQIIDLRNVFCHFKENFASNTVLVKLCGNGEIENYPSQPKTSTVTYHLRIIFL